jgi:hypothetical protein
VRPIAVCAACVLALLGGGPAAAQETQQDVADRIVREQEALRTRRIADALGAPAKAFDRIESKPRIPAEKPVEKKSGPSAWLIAGCAAGLLALIAAFRAAWRRAGR